MRVGILGAGSIANVMAKTIQKIDKSKDIILYAVASRSLDKARDFASNYENLIAYGSYEELLQDSNVDLVYIATPHSHHYEQMKMCINYGKAVLCEKAFTANAKQAKEILELSKEKNVFVAEAIWTRYMPSRKVINDLLAEEIVGKISMVTANLSYDIDGKERIIKAELAGGALLDIGIYGLNFFLMHLGKDYSRIDSSVVLTESGVDAMETISFIYNDLMATTTHSIYGRSDRKGIFTGEKGYIIVDNINNPKEVNVYDKNDALIKNIKMEEQISGYEYELYECKKAMEEGRIMSYSMTHDETIYVMELMDKIRKDFGVKYPFE